MTPEEEVVRDLLPESILVQEGTWFYLYANQKLYELGLQTGHCKTIYTVGAGWGSREDAWREAARRLCGIL